MLQFRTTALLADKVEYVADVQGLSVTDALNSLVSFALGEFEKEQGIDLLKLLEDKALMQPSGSGTDDGASGPGQRGEPGVGED